MLVSIRMFERCEMRDNNEKPRILIGIVLVLERGKDIDLSKSYMFLCVPQLFIEVILRRTNVCCSTIIVFVLG